MNTQFFTLASIHILLSLVIGVVFLYLTYIIVKQIFNRRKLVIEKDNIAFGIFAASIMFTVGYIFSGIFEPSMMTAQLLMNAYENTMTFVLQYMKYLGLFLLFGSIAAALIVFTAVKVFDMLTTTVDEFLEISEGNVAVSLILSSMIIVVALLSKTSITMLIEAIVPFPKIPGIF
jgi:uncharacterized membrane protein YjfL (UPF0719 family)